MHLRCFHLSILCTKCYEICKLLTCIVNLPLHSSLQETWKSTARYIKVSATLSGVIGPVFTEIHKSSSSLAALFFFFVSDLVLVSGQQQLQHPPPWRQQQQWQHNSRAVRKTSKGRLRSTARQIVLYAPWLCLSITKRQSWLNKSSILSTLPSMAVRSLNRVCLAAVKT